MSDDYIKKEDAIREVKKYRGLDRITMAMLADDMRAIKPADVVERKRGKWVADMEHQYHYRCSNCRILAQSECKIWNFCPNCGADMRGDDNETDRP